MSTECKIGNNPTEIHLYESNNYALWQAKREVSFTFNPFNYRFIPWDKGSGGLIQSVFTKRFIFTMENSKNR